VKRILFQWDEVLASRTTNSCLSLLFVSKKRRIAPRLPHCYPCARSGLLPISSSVHASESLGDGDQGKTFPSADFRSENELYPTFGFCR
jgi:hypothetical protein